jgi:hypothetical protein
VLTKDNVLLRALELLIRDGCGIVRAFTPCVLGVIVWIGTMNCRNANMVLAMCNGIFSSEICASKLELIIPIPMNGITWNTCCNV